VWFFPPFQPKIIKNASSRVVSFNAGNLAISQPGNRIAWRGPSFLKDGQNVRRNISDGWFDTGGHWKTNDIMGDWAMMLAQGLAQK